MDTNKVPSIVSVIFAFAAICMSIAALAKFAEIRNDFGDKIDQLRAELRAELRDELQTFEVELHKLSTPSDCSFNRGMTHDNIQNIYVGGEDINVLCDTKGSIVLLKRFDGTLSFNKTFQQYSDGFGDMKTEFWTGLKYVHNITSSSNWTLRIDLEDKTGEKRYAEYTGFSVGAGSNFTLNFDENSYSGTAGDALQYHHGLKFSPPDHDVDGWSGGNVAAYYGGGWWYTDYFFDALLTGTPGTDYLTQGYDGKHLLYWDTWKEDELATATMSIYIA